MRARGNTPVVLFNASVILAGLHSPKGGSAKILSWAKKRKIRAVASEVILDEVFRRAGRINLQESGVKRKLRGVFFEITPPPKEKSVSAFKKVVIDVGDAHVLASGKEIKVDYLVTLDRKHILSLKKYVRQPKIVTPGELIEILTK